MEYMHFHFLNILFYGICPFFVFTVFPLLYQLGTFEGDPYHIQDWSIFVTINRE